jgi:hypothetical protein
MAMNTNSVMSGSFAKGTFSGTTAYEIKMKFAPLPATVWVRPSAGTVSVLYSVDEGTNYTAVTALTAAAAYADLTINGPVTNIKFVGDGVTSAGSWGIC